VVFTDHLTRWVEAVPMRCAKAGDPTSLQVAKALMTEVISRHGVPETVLSDQGTAFCKGVMRHIIQWLEIDQLTTSPYHPQCNGLVERFNRTFIGMLRTYPARTRDTEWDERLPLLLFAYRCHYNRNAKTSPFFLRYGHMPSTPASLFLGHTDATARSQEEWLKEVVEFMPRNWHKVQEILEEHAQKIHKENEQLLLQGKLREYEVGERVYALNHESESQKLQYKVKPTWLGPYTVKRKISITTYELEDEATQQTFIAWCGHLKPAHDQAAALNRPARPNAARAGNAVRRVAEAADSQEDKAEEEEKKADEG